MGNGRRSELRGILVPILTPLLPNERVDTASLRRLVRFLLGAGVHGIWALGTTGEFAALDAEQRARAASAVVDEVGGRVPVVVNIGDSGTGLALRHAAAAVEAGADYLALTPPHYFPHSQDELRTHFEQVKDRFADIPLLAYNIPQTVKVKLSVDTALTLAVKGIIHGIKDSQNDLQWFRQLSVAVTAEGLRDEFRMFVGTRSLIDVSVHVGAHGAVPAVANVAPAECVAAYQLSLAGDGAAALAAQLQALRYEQLAGSAAGGSANAGLLSVMKTVLRHRGVLDTADLTAPLRPLTMAEARRVIDEADQLAHQAAP
ncbi:MAG TPA: dihydrodipicolinate synthase family protein [Mycobacterium sp.]|nr:dihydrodipicolinate synthase family protein [Mycobacterium sp.]